MRVAFLGGKSHVVPSNPVRVSHHNSIPRLELVAATKAAEMKGAIEKSIKRQFDSVFLWTNSESVLKQIADIEEQTICGQQAVKNLEVVGSGELETRGLICAHRVSRHTKERSGAFT